MNDALIPAASVPLATPPASPIEAARLRLDQSRARIRQAITVPPPAPGVPPRSALGLLPLAWRDGLATLGEKAREHPVSGALIEAVGGWWQAHPWRQVVEIVSEEAGDRVLPWMRRHSLGLAVAAFVGSALVVTLRPWRWHPLRRSVRVLPRSLSRWVLGELRRVPLQSAFVAVLLMLAGKKTADAAAAAAPATPGTAAAAGPTVGSGPVGTV